MSVSYKAQRGESTKFCMADTNTKFCRAFHISVGFTERRKEKHSIQREICHVLRQQLCVETFPQDAWSVYKVSTSKFVFKMRKVSC